MQLELDGKRAVITRPGWRRTSRMGGSAARKKSLTSWRSCCRTARRGSPGRTFPSTGRRYTPAREGLT